MCIRDRGTWVEVRDAVKKALPAEAPKPASIKSNAAPVAAAVEVAPAVEASEEGQA